jgi:membrane protein DedA with SNARE-associated domain
VSVLDGLLERTLEAVAAGGWSALALAMVVESLFPPIPSEVVLPLAGFTVHSGRLAPAAAVAAATAGLLGGASLLYAAGRWGGRPLLHRYEWLLRLDDAQLDRADAWFDRHGPALVFWSRMVPLARSAVSVPAGMSEMPFGRFAVLTTAGSMLWNAALIGAGYALGDRWEQVSDLVGAYGVAALAVLSTLAVVGVLLARRRRARPRAPGGQGAVGP